MAVKKLLQILLFIIINYCGEGVKIWSPNTNFENPNNWDFGRQPNCDRDTVIFPPAPSISVFIQQSLAVKSIVLPLNGELILPLKGIIDVKNDPRQRIICDGQTLRFINSAAAHWFDPQNWKLNHEDELVVPHSERVPCLYDGVFFPPNSSFKVKVEGIEASISSFTINQRVLGVEELRWFLRSDSGRRQFEVDSRLTLTGAECGDLSGCACGNDNVLPLAHICNHVRDNCPLVRCSDPIRPVGFCCDLCGATISSTIGYRFHMKRFQDFIAAYTEKSVYSSVSAYVYKTSGGGVETVLADRELPRRSADMMKHIQRDLATDAQKAYLDVTFSSGVASVVWLDGPEALNQHLPGMGAGGVAALIFGLLALIIIALLFYVQRHRLLPLAFSFGRFENEEDGYPSSGFEMAQPTSSPPPKKPPRTPDAKTTEPSVGFVNPFYNSEGEDGQKAIVFLEEKREPGENPGYMSFERLEDILETKENEHVDDAEEK